MVQIFKDGYAPRFLVGDYEALFRWSLVRMALEQRGVNSQRLHLTESMRSLDRTEKGMVNYFLGMTFCKLFASKLLGTPWLLHLDVFRDQLDIVLRQGSRPDLVGEEHGSGRWHGFECKGRMRSMSDAEKRNAKAQASSVVSVAGVTCSLQHWFRELLPPEHTEFLLALTLRKMTVSGSNWNSREDAWEHYFRPVVGVLTALREDDALNAQDTRRDSNDNLFVRVAQCDLEVGVHQAVEQHLMSGRWTDARLATREQAERIRGDGFHADGLRIRAGESWTGRYEEPPPPRVVRIILGSRKELVCLSTATTSHSVPARFERRLP